MPIPSVVLADPLVENNNGWTVLHAGVNADKLECVSPRLRLNPNPNPHPNPYPNPNPNTG